MDYAKVREAERRQQIKNIFLIRDKNHRAKAMAMFLKQSKLEGLKNQEKKTEDLVMATPKRTF